MTAGMKDGGSGRAKAWWCAGCGNHDVLASVESTLGRLAVPEHELLVVSGVGCSGKTSGFLSAYSVQALHGRTLPLATGAKLANPKLTVVAIGGDSDGYAIGVSHLIHAAKRDVDLTYLVLNNSTMALTEGQQLPGSEINSPGIDPLAVALGAGAGFIARVNANDQALTSSLIQRAIQHVGFAIVDIRSPCIVYGRSPFSYGPHMADHEATDLVAAFRALVEADLSGVIYERHPRRRAVKLSKPSGHSPVTEQLDRLISQLSLLRGARPVCSTAIGPSDCWLVPQEK